ncbi:MAG: formyltransferase family protein [Rhodospirillales bacterium]|nr:formyltransferase family protein [Rhodospirillales bacterium]
MNMVGESLRAVVIGAGKPLIDCVKVILSYNEENPESTCHLVCSIVDLVGATNSTNPQEKVFFEKNELPYYCSSVINSSEIIGIITDLKADIIFSINNHQIIREPLLSSAPKGIINFHNGPLPRYGGLNACTWAIANGEIEHGVTWHYVSAQVDGGDIIAQRSFVLEDDITAIKLVFKCIHIGTELFRNILPLLVAGEVNTIKQPQGERLYYKKKQVPNEGKIEFGWNYLKFDRFVRSLSFLPLENPINYPVSTFNGKVFYIEKTKLISRSSSGKAGSVVKSEADHLYVELPDATVALTRLRDSNKKPIKVRDFIKQYGVSLGSYMGT